MNDILLRWDEFVFGAYPFVWLSTTSNPLKPLLDLLTPQIILCFRIMSLLLGLSLVFFFTKPKISAGLVVSIFVTMAVGLVFWQLFPVNSPNNFFLSANPQIDGYDPNQLVLQFQEQVRFNQRNLPPICTFPSAHVMWGMEIVYFWALYKKRTLFFSVPWFSMNTLGTVFLAQHFAVDVLLALLTGAASIAAGCLAARLAVRPSPMALPSES